MQCSDSHHCNILYHFSKRISSNCLRERNLEKNICSLLILPFKATYNLMIFKSGNCARKNKVSKNSEQFWKIEREQISFSSTYITPLIQEIEKCFIKRIVQHYIGDSLSIIWLYSKKNRICIKRKWQTNPLFIL